jgi:hypothetical protein
LSISFRDLHHGGREPPKPAASRPHARVTLGQCTITEGQRPRCEGDLLCALTNADRLERGITTAAYWLALLLGIGFAAAGIIGWIADVTDGGSDLAFWLAVTAARRQRAFV